MVAEKNRHADERYRQRGGVLPDCKARNDVCGMAGLRRLRDFPHGAIRGRSIVVRNQHDEAGQHQTHERCGVERVR